jgi:hypothetical protein
MYSVITNFKMQGQEMDAGVTNGMFAQVSQADFAGSVYDYCSIREWGTGYVQNRDIKTSPISCYYSDVRMMGLNIIEGTNFTFNEPYAQFILNETAVKLMGLTDPVGK